MTATFRTDALMCDCCGVELPEAFLAKCPVTGGFVCLACREKAALAAVCALLGEAAAVARGLE